MAVPVKEEYYNRTGVKTLVAFDPYLQKHPESYPENPWDKLGDSTALISRTFDTSAVKEYYAINDNRADDFIMFQRTDKVNPRGDLVWEVKLSVTSNGVNGSSVSVIQFIVSDGVRKFGFAVGDTLNLINSSGVPLTGDPNKSISKTNINTITLKKIRNLHVELYLNGVYVTQIPYTACESAESGDGSQFIKWGSVSTTASANFKVYYLQYSIEYAYAEDEPLRKVTLELPKFVNKTVQVFKAISRSIMSEMVLLKNTLNAIPTFNSRAPLILESITLSNSLLPANQEYAWTVTGDTILQAVVNNSLQIDLFEDTKSIFYERSNTSLTQFHDIEFQFTLEVRQHTHASGGGASYYGPQVHLSDGTRKVSCLLYEDANNQKRISLANANETTDTVSDLLGDSYVIDPSNYDKPLRIKIFKSYNNEAWLIVNSEIVSAVPYSSFQTTSDKKIKWGVDSYSDETGEFYFKDVSYVISLYGSVNGSTYLKFPVNPNIRRRSQDLLVFPTYLETENEAWHKLVCAVGLHKWRGREFGILREAKWLAGSTNVFLVKETTPAGWWLDLSDYVDFVFLDSTDTLAVNHLDVQMLNKNYRPSELGELLWKFIVPAIKHENLFQINNIWLVSGKDNTPPTTTILTVDRVDDIAVNDAVTVVKKSDPTNVKENATVTAVGSTTITVTKLTLAASFPNNDTYVRKKIKGRE